MAKRPAKRRPAPVPAQTVSLEPDFTPTLMARIVPWVGTLWLAAFGYVFFSSLLPNAQDRSPGLSRDQLLIHLPELYSTFWANLHNPATPSGWQYLPQRFDLIGCAAFILLTAVCLGRLCLRGLGLFSMWDRPVRLALTGGVGLSALSLVTLALGLAGVFSQAFDILLFTSIVLAELFCTFTFRSTPSLAPVPQSDPAPGWIKWSCVTICIPFLICMGLGALLPEMDFDVKEYHLQGPKEYLQSGRIHFLPHNVYTSFPFLTEMLSLTGMVIRNDWERGALVGKAVLAAFAPLTALGVWCLVRWLSGAAAAWLAATIWLTTPWTYRLANIAYTEGASCCYVILPLLALWLWHELPIDEQNRRMRFRTAILTGLLAGSAAATKYPCMVFVTVPLGVAMLMLSLRQRPFDAKTSTSNLLGYALGVLLTFGPWLLKNLVETGNPVYPLLYSIFGGVDWDAELQLKFQKGHSTKPDEFWNLWLQTWAMVIENDWQSPMLFSLAPLAWLRPRTRGLWWLAVDALLILAAWFFLTHRIDRFWVPVIPVLAALAGIGLWNLLQLSQRETPALTALLRAPALGMCLLVVTYHFAFITTALCGTNSYLTDLPTVAKQSTTYSIALLESLPLSTDSKVLMVGEAEVFNAHFPLVYNTVFDFSLLEQQTSRKLANGKWELLPAADIRRTWSEQQLTHVFVNWQEVLRYRTTYEYTNFVSPARMRELVDLGLLRELPLPQDLVLRHFANQSVEYQDQLNKWGPELKQGGEVVMFQLFEIVR